MLIGIPDFLIADPLDNWHLRNPLPQGNDLSGVTYGNDTFVAVGDSGTILTSPDGVAWTTRTSGTNSDLTAVAYGNDTFVAVGGSTSLPSTGGTILTSPDGVTWTIRTSGTNYYLYGVTYGNGTFVAVGDSGTILTSPDGVTWTTRTSGTNYELHGVVYGNGTFVVVGHHLPSRYITNNEFYGTILTSPDGVTWTTRNSETAYRLFGVIYGNGTFVAVGTYGTILQSDQTSCSYTISPTGRSHGSGAETGSVSVTVGSNCFWMASTNSGSWDWIGISSGWSGIGNGTVNYFVLANNTGNTRTGTLTIADQTFTITQTAGGCSYSISPPSNSFSGAAGTGSVSVTAGAGCSWTAFLDPGSWGWLGISAGASNWGGTGSGTVNYYCFANNTGSTRSGYLTIAGQTFTITQQGQQDACASVVCTATDQCHTAGVCNPATGVCSNPVDQRTTLNTLETVQRFIWWKPDGRVDLYEGLGCLPWKEDWNQDNEPFDRDNYCGPTAAKNLLYWYEAVEHSYDQLGSEMHTNDWMSITEALKTRLSPNFRIILKSLWFSG